MSQRESGQSPERALVTGPGGFLGRHLCRQLISEGWEVRGLQRSHDQGLEALGVELISGSVLDPKTLAEAAEGCSLVYHLAGSVDRTPGEGAGALYDLHLGGARGLIGLLEARPELKALALSSSGTLGVSRDSQRLANEESPVPWGLISAWPYYASKAYAERELMSAAARGLPIYLARPSLFLGPGDLRGSSTGDVSQFLSGRLRVCPPGGVALVDVRDVAAFLPRLIEHGRPGVGYILSAANLSLRDFFTRLSQISGVAAPPLDLPSSLLKSAAPLFKRLARSELFGAIDGVSFEMGCHYWYVDASAAQALGFQPRPVEETLTATVQDLVSRGLFFSDFK